jgi:hypothetical protein
MKWFASLLLIVLFELYSGILFAIDLSQSEPLVMVEIQSYGEPTTALNELLVSFFAKRQFAYDRPRSVSDDGILLAVYSNIDPADSARFDALVVNGKFNCVAVTYYGMAYKPRNRRKDVKLPEFVFKDAQAPERALAFMRDLKEFLIALPYPRIKVADIKLGSKQACGNAL